MENKETKNIEKKDKNIGLIVLSTAGIVGSVGLGVLCYQLSKENKALKIDKKLYKDAYENLADKLTKIAETGELVKRVVGGPLIDRLIKNDIDGVVGIASDNENEFCSTEDEVAGGLEKFSSALFAIFPFAGVTPNVANN